MSNALLVTAVHVKMKMNEEQFPVPRNTAGIKIGNGVISLL